jgi:hypothetical protein
MLYASYNKIHNFGTCNKICQSFFLWIFDISNDFFWWICVVKTKFTFPTKNLLKILKLLQLWWNFFVWYFVSVES